MYTLVWSSVRLVAASVKRLSFWCGLLQVLSILQSSFFTDSFVSVPISYRTACIGKCVVVVTIFQCVPVVVTIFRCVPVLSAC